MTESNNKPPASGWGWIDNSIAEKVSEVGPAAMTIYVLLVTHANQSRVCHPSLARLSQLSGLSERHTRRALSRLVEAGMVSKTKRVRPDGGWTINEYHLLPLPPPLATGHICPPDTSVQTTGHQCPLNKKRNKTLLTRQRRGLLPRSERKRKTFRFPPNSTLPNSKPPGSNG